MDSDITAVDDAILEDMAQCRYCGASCDVSDVTLYGAVYDVSSGTRSGGVVICEDCCERFDRDPDTLITEVVNFRERLELARTPCKCDPPGSGEEYCTGHCELNAVIKRLRTAMDLEDPGEDPWAELARLRGATEKARDILDGVERRMIDAGQAAEDDEDEDWWGDTVEELREAIAALAPQPAENVPHNRTETGQGAPQGTKSSNALPAPATGETAAS
jgi:hypothetical protein